ncbi:MAG: hypothetical protein K8S20_15305 [Chloroflexi bacterium]|nr:hypothetical protein [Chloroflexota bacterium]
MDKPRLRDLADKVGIEMGISLRIIDRWKLYRYPEYLKSIMQFSMIKDGYTSWPDSWMNDLGTYEYLVQMGRFAKKNKMGFSVDQFLDEGWFEPPAQGVLLHNASKEQFDLFMQDIVRKYFEVPYFTDLTFASEPTGASNVTPPYWKTNNPMYRIYGKDWPEVTYRLAWDEALRTGRSVGKDLTFVYAAAGQIEVPKSPHAELEFKHLSELKAKLTDSLGIERPFAIGMEYHIHDGAPVRGGCGGPAVSQLKKNELIEHFQRFNEIGDVMINESSISGPGDPEKKKEALHVLLEAAIESNVVKRILFWTPFFQPTGNAENDAVERSCDALGMFKEDYTPDYMFDEMYKIFETYTS